MTSVKTLYRVAVAGVLAGLSACTTLERDPDKLLVEARAVYDEEAREHPGRIDFPRDEMTRGIIEDYVKVIEFLARRKDFTDSAQANIPIFPRPEPYPQVVLHYMGRFKIDRGDRPGYLNEKCGPECAKILFEGHADSVVLARVNADTLDVDPESLRVFRKSDSCSIPADFSPSNWPETPALGLCTEMTLPEDGMERLQKDGLYVFETRSSPLWPEEFFMDGSKRLIQGHPMLAVTRGNEVKLGLSEVRATAPQGFHRSVVEIRGGEPQKPQLLFERLELSIDPSIPEPVVRQLIRSSAGDSYLSESRESNAIRTDDHGMELRTRTYHLRRDTLIEGKLDYASLFSQADTVSRLESVLAQAQQAGPDASQWDALTQALGRVLPSYPDLNTGLGSKLAPIVIAVAQNDTGTDRLSPQIYGVVQHMPAGSLAPYLPELIEVIERKLEAVGYQGLDCPAGSTYANRESEPSLWNLAELLNAAGPGAADYLDKIRAANERRGNSCDRIGGEYKAAACIGAAGPVISEALKRIPGNRKDCPR